MAVYVETDKLRPIEGRLLNPHYNNRQFKEPQTVFLAPGYRVVSQSTYMIDELFYNFSDRLRQAYGDKCDDAWKAAEAKGSEKNNAAFFETYLRQLHEDPELQLAHIVAGVDRHGYSFHVYGSILSKKAGKPA